MLLKKLFTLLIVICKPDQLQTPKIVFVEIFPNEKIQSHR